MSGGLVEWLKALEVALIASVKFALAPFEAERQGFDFAEALGVTVAGGTAGVLVFVFAGDVIVLGWKKLMAKFKKHSSQRRKIHTGTNRLIVRTRRRFGIMGIAFISPSLLSIPVGAFLIQRLYKGTLRNILWMFAAIVFWGLVLNYIAQFLSLSQYF